jgi:redox-sensing transcriptional repressor
MSSKVSDAVVRRLPKYYRRLSALAREGVTRISSQELSARMNVTASQIRQDFSCFGGFGQQGYGYNVHALLGHIAGILGLGKRYAVVVVGAGNIAQALVGYAGFAAEGYDVTALFDTDPGLIGKRFGGAQVLPADAMEAFLAEHPADIGVIAVPEEAAAQAAEKLSGAGVRAIWNFAPVDIVLSGAAVENAHLTDGLMALTYRLGELRGGAGREQNRS